jgi:high-affinity iron transporter
VTNVLLIIFAAGLVGVGIHEFNEAGIVPAIVEHIWDINGVLSDKSEVGLLLKALVGYNGNPSLTEVLAYLVYLSGISVTLILRRQNQKQITATSAAD